MASSSTNNDDKEAGVSESSSKYARPSIAIKMIRHAESRNNQVYSDAHSLFRSGTESSDLFGWQAYVEQHRRADPDLSESGTLQAAALAEYLVPMVSREAVTEFVLSPMRRTLETIRPTVQSLLLGSSFHITVHGFYFEVEGCHTAGVAEEGMNPSQIQQLLFPTKQQDKEQQQGLVLENRNEAESTGSINFVGFPHEDDPSRGWWTRDGIESRAMAEDRAAKFFVWLCEHLDGQLADNTHPGIFDAGAHTADNGQRRRRKRKTMILVGHGDFMSLVLKRIVTGFGHAVEVAGVPHRSAFVHWNTGITELEYFGQGRFLMMSQNTTPHLLGSTAANHHHHLLTGGSLKDGWSFFMPHNDEFRVDVVFSDHELDGSAAEQKEALKALYLSSHNHDDDDDDDAAAAATGNGAVVDKPGDYSVEEESCNGAAIHHFVVRQGFQVVGVATYSQSTGRIFDVAVRPSASKSATEMLFNAIKDHSKRFGRSGSLLVQPRTEQGKQMFASVGFRHSKPEEESHMEYQH